MFKNYRTNNLCHEYNTVHIIKHAFSSTHYGIRKPISLKNDHSDSSFVVCFENKKDALHVMKSITTHKAVYQSNPDSNRLCIYNTHELIDNDVFIPIEYGLYMKEIYLNDLLTQLFQRNIGICLINDIYHDNDDRNVLNIKSINIYPTEPLQLDIKCIEDDYLL